MRNANRALLSVLGAALALLVATLVPAPWARSQSAVANSEPSAAPIPTRLRHLADGAVVVEFKAVAGAVYRVQYANELATSPAAMSWSMAVDNLIATNNGWVVWVDEGAADRIPPGQVTERYYQVIRTAEAPTAAGEGPVTGAKSASSASAAATNVAAGSGSSVDNRLAQLQEALDAGVMIGALKVGRYADALAVLRKFGVAEATLALMAMRLGQPVPPVDLEEPFLKGVLMWGQRSPQQFQKDFALAESLGFGRDYWIQGYEGQSQPLTPGAIGAFWGSPYQANAIQLFKWFDQHADDLHSLTLNLGSLHNEYADVPAADRNAVLGGLFQLVKARSPTTLVWLTVWFWEDGSDVSFLQSLPFRPDGLLIVNLHSFSSPFERARDRYRPLVGPDTLLVVMDFQGYWPTAETAVANPDLGRLIGPQLDPLENRLQSLGYRGLIVNWFTLHHVVQGAQ